MKKKNLTKKKNMKKKIYFFTILNVINSFKINIIQLSHLILFQTKSHLI